MGSSTRHRTIASPQPPLYLLSTWVAESIRAYCDAKGLPPKVAERLVRGFFREQAAAIREERRKLRPVADQRHRAPVGEPLEADPQLEVQREGCLPDQPRRD